MGGTGIGFGMLEEEIRDSAYLLISRLEYHRADDFYERIKNKPEEIINRYNSYLQSTHFKTNLGNFLGTIFNRKRTIRECAVGRYYTTHFLEHQEQRMEEARKILERGEADMVCG